MVIDKDIKITVDGVEVEGRIVNRSEADIDITIIKPYINIFNGLHIPCFGRPYCSYTGEYGDKTAEILLKRTFIFARFLDENKQELKHECQKLQKEIDEISIKKVVDDDLREERKVSRKKLRQGQISLSDHQKRLSALRKEISQYSFIVWNKTDKFFENNFPDIIPVGTRDNIIEILEGKKDLYPETAQEDCFCKGENEC